MNKKICYEDVKSYIDKNYDICFVEALTRCMKETLDLDKDSLEQLIWQGIKEGVKEYLQEYEGEAVKILAEQFMETIGEKGVSINFG